METLRLSLIIHAIFHNKTSLRYSSKQESLIAMQFMLPKLAVSHAHIDSFES